MRFLNPIYIALVLFSIFQSCGYHLGHGGKLDNYRTIEVPFVRGDLDGSMTAAIVKQITRVSPFTYVSCRGDLILDIEVIDVWHDNIGFRFERNTEGERIKDLVPAETRLYTILQVQVLDPCRGCALLGPARIRAYVDFDHDYYASPDEINIFSLGQVVDVDTAFDSAQKPLNERLAEKVVDYISDSW